MTGRNDKAPMQKDSPKIGKKRAAHNTTDTQRESWDKYKESRARLSHDGKVLAYLKEHEANNLELSFALKLPINVITKATNTLRKKGLIGITCKKECQRTKRRTQFYQATTNGPGEQGEAVLGLFTGQQGELFASTSTPIK